MRTNKPPIMDATKIKSCDTCDYQEGHHYCLLHTRQVKNMDIVRCRDWAPPRWGGRCGKIRSFET